MCDFYKSFQDIVCTATLFDSGTLYNITSYPSLYIPGRHVKIHIKHSYITLVIQHEGDIIYIFHLLIDNKIQEALENRTTSAC